MSAVADAPGPDRIVVCEGGSFCQDCRRDLDDGTDRDPTLYLIRTEVDGTCSCCGGRIENGHYTDEGDTP